MKLRWPLFLTLLLTAGAAAQTNCNEGSGPLNTAPPPSITPAEIIQKFSANEARFKQAHATYSYTKDVVIQTLALLKFGGTTITGEYQQVSRIAVDAHGNTTENIVFAPQNTLREVSVTREDLDDIRALAGFILTPSDLPEYEVRYAGQQHVDEVETYVFDVHPKHIDQGRRYFEGRAWVDAGEYAIVKTCGKRVPDQHGKKQENLTPKFVIYREEIDGLFWFPTYLRADDVLRFARTQTHIRETIKLTKYERSAATGNVGTEVAPRDGAGDNRPGQPSKKL